MGNEQIGVTISFEPRNLGKFSSFIEMSLFNSYHFPIKVGGCATNYSTKEKGRRGPEALKEDFEKPKNYVDEDRAVSRNKVSRRNDRLIFTNQDEESDMLHIDATDVSEKLGQFFSVRNNKQKYNEYLFNQRTSRNNEKHETFVKAKFEKLKTKINEVNPGFFPKEREDDDKAVPPVDMEFWFKMDPAVDLGEPFVNLPSAKDPLWVNKAIGKYEPMSEIKSEKFKPDPNKPIKRKFHSKPTSHAEDRDVHMELTPEMLQKVFSGPKSIDFGHIYKKSKSSKYFSVKNELRTSIMVQINVDGIDELSGTDTQPQIIPTMQIGVFEIVCSSRAEQDFKNYVTYIINGQHRFKFLVSAQIEPVQLEVNRDNIRFVFTENNNEMTTSETIKITNKGNAPGRFKWDKISGDVFSVDRTQGEVPANGGEVLVNIIYKPSGKVFKGEEENLKLKVDDGIDRIVKCVGFVTEAKCIWKGSSVYNIGDIPVGQTRTFHVTLLNASKSTATYHILTDKLPYCMNINPVKGRIGMDNSEPITVTIQSNEEMAINHELVALIRGGQPQKLLLQGQVIVPKVHIQQEDFDFGEVLYDNTASLPLTISNESDITAHLLLDLRSRVGIVERPPGIECLEVVPATDLPDDESSIMQSMYKDDDNESSIFY